MVILAVTLVATGLAAGWDIRTGRVPNAITFSALVLGFILNSYYLGAPGFIDAFTGALVGAMLLLIPFLLGGMGAGDVKILAAVGALNGARFTFSTFLYGAVVGGIIGLVLTLARRKMRPVLTGLFVALTGSGIDYSPCILLDTGYGSEPLVSSRVMERDACGSDREPRARAFRKASGTPRPVRISGFMQPSGIKIPYAVAIFAGTLAAYLLR
ncbi:MAG TPA: prepilin peptidase [Firmicutes bacterium]|nr:prepilin peptidase [Candidatus Fermentithermobacillaceae bacterium]